MSSTGIMSFQTRFTDGTASEPSRFERAPGVNTEAHQAMLQCVDDEMKPSAQASNSAKYRLFREKFNGLNPKHSQIISESALCEAANTVEQPYRGQTAISSIWPNIQDYLPTGAVNTQIIPLGHFKLENGNMYVAIYKNWICYAVSKTTTIWYRGKTFKVVGDATEAARAFYHAYKNGSQNTWFTGSGEKFEKEASKKLPLT